MSDVRLTVAAHRSFPGNLLDGAVPNGGQRDAGRVRPQRLRRRREAAERDRSQAMLMFSPGVDEVLDVLADSRRLRPEMALIVAIPGPANGNLAEALRAGAHEIVLLPAEAPVVSDAVHKAMARASTAPVAAAPAAAMAPIVAVLGPKGGVGKTTVARTWRPSWPATGKRVLLIDLDLQFGDVGLVLGVEPERTIYDLVTARGQPRRRQAAGVPGHQRRRCRRAARAGAARPGGGGDRRAAGRGDRRRPSGVRRRHRRYATGVHGRGDRRRRSGGAHRDRRLARPAGSEEHEGRDRDAPPDGRQRATG